MSLEVHNPTFPQKMNANIQHKCEICEMVFKTQKTFKNHFRIVHDNKRKACKVIYCNILGLGNQKNRFEILCYWNFIQFFSPNYVGHLKDVQGV